MFANIIFSFRRRKMVVHLQPIIGIFLIICVQLCCLFFVISSVGEHRAPEATGVRTLLGEVTRDFTLPQGLFNLTKIIWSRYYIMFFVYVLYLVIVYVVTKLVTSSIDNAIYHCPVHTYLCSCQVDNSIPGFSRISILFVFNSYLAQYTKCNTCHPSRHHVYHLLSRNYVVLYHVSCCQFKPTLANIPNFFSLIPP